MLSIYNQLLTAGIMPVACTLNPSNALGGVDTNLTAFNTWIVRNAQLMGLPLVDFYGALASDSGGYAAGLNNDNVHQSPAGAKVMGTAIWNALKPLVVAQPPWISQDQPTTDATRKIGNALFLTDTNADGVPDLWAVSGAPTVALATDTANFGARSGKVWTITRGASNAVATLTPAVTLTPGGRLWYAIKFATTGVQAAGGSIDIHLESTDQATELLGMQAWPAQDTAGMAVYVLAGEMVMPSGLPSNNLQIRCQIRTGGTLKLAQPTLIDLAAAGIA